jgi:hypothetical protein
MEQATIEVDDEELGRSAAGTVWGNIRLRIGDIVFPHMEWSDFIVAILDAWCLAALRLLQGEKGTAVVSFMEGPYLVELRSSAPGLWHVSLVEDGSRRRVRHSADIEIATLVYSILDGSELVMAACQKKGWWYRDTDHLSAASAELRKKIRQLMH